MVLEMGSHSTKSNSQRLRPPEDGLPGHSSRPRTGMDEGSGFAFGYAVAGFILDRMARTKPGAGGGVDHGEKQRLTVLAAGRKVGGGLEPSAGSDVRRRPRGRRQPRAETSIGAILTVSLSHITVRAHTTTARPTHLEQSTEACSQCGARVLPGPSGRTRHGRSTDAWHR